jgi:hypothetical protein
MHSIGKIIYSPRSHIGSNQNWAILACDDSISEYYRQLYDLEQPPYLNGNRALKIIRPVWGSHCSFIRSSDDNPKQWGIDANKTVEFEYEPGVLDNGVYYWLQVKCPYILGLREKMGLPSHPKYGLHLTIGVAAK